ncbi:MAG: ABC transporter ATP-binding protein [Gammaproteobacteria bacterium]
MRNHIIKPAIEVANLYHAYGAHRALSNINFSVSPGSITAVVGPNGAGKSTLFKCLIGLESPVQGTIHIDSINIIDNPRAINGKIAYLAENIGVYDQLTIRQSLNYAASLHLMKVPDVNRSVQELCKELAIDDRLDVKLSKLSKGLRQCVAIAQAVIHSPSIILLDEPSSGLDPEARHRVISLFKKLQQNGATLLISTHLLSEIESYYSNLLIIKDGHLIRSEGVNKAQTNLTLIKLKMDEGQASVVNELELNPKVSFQERTADGVTFYFNGDKEQQAKLLKSLVSLNSTISSFEVVPEDLQKKYFKSMKTNRSL